MGIPDASGETTTPMCRCCHRSGVFKNLFTDFVNENETENYSQMLHFSFGIVLVPAECDNIYTICDNCIVKLRIATQFKTSVIANEIKLKSDQLMEDDDGPIKIEKAWSCATGEKEEPL